MPKLSQEFARPAILIGYAGGKVVEELRPEDRLALQLPQRQGT